MARNYNVCAVCDDDVYFDGSSWQTLDDVDHLCGGEPDGPTTPPLLESQSSNEFTAWPAGTMRADGTCVGCGANVGGKMPCDPACPIDGERVDADPLAILVRRGVVTTDPDGASECCGMPRDADGFCQHRPEHPIYVRRS